MSRIRVFPVVILLLFVTFTLRLGDFIAELASGTPAHLESSEAKAEEPAAAKADAKPDDKKDGDKKDAKKDVNTDRQEIPAKSDKPPEDNDVKGVDKDPFENGYNEDEVKVLQSLSQRRDKLDQRERDLEQREKLLQAAEKKVDEKVVEMDKLKEQIQGLLANQQKMQDSRIAQLVKIYENMKPKDAANIFNEMDFDVLIEIIDKMSERKVAPVLAAMDATRAREVSARIALQKALPPKADDAAAAPAK
jgi:flagellar motility protein MotE (MotC chaperone)